LTFQINQVLFAVNLVKVSFIILLLSQGFNQREAILKAVAARKRAIYMSTGTSIIGMLPLMISPENSAEIYRGLASVIFGGMVFSALFSISFMSALLSLPAFAREGITAVVGKQWLGHRRPEDPV